ncbi:MAG: hypothetical protein RI885_293 [Actinomycetota bacterium]
MQYAYHRLARSAPKYAWWKALVVGVIGTAIYLFLSVIVGVAVFAIAIFTDPDFDGSTDSINALVTRFTELDLTDPLVFTLAVGSIALMLPSAFLARLTLGPRPVGLISSVAGRLRWGWLARCIVPAAVVYGVVFGLSFLVLDPLLGAEPIAPVVSSTTLVLVLLAIILTPLQATAEEYVFRGYLMQTIGGWLKHPAWAILLPVPLFAIGHDYDLWGLLDVSLFAIAAGYLTWRTGGLEAAIVAHVINNTTLFVLGAFGLVDLNAKSGSPIALVSTVVLMGAYSALVVWQAKRTGLVTTREVAPAATPVGSVLGAGDHAAFGVSFASGVPAEPVPAADAPAADAPAPAAPAPAAPAPAADVSAAPAPAAPAPAAPALIGPSAPSAEPSATPAAPSATPPVDGWTPPGENESRS